VSVGVIALLAGALVAVGCGDAEPRGPEVTLRVTRDFGRVLLGEERLPLDDHGTPLRLLEEHHEVRVTKYRTVEAIDGLHQTYADNLSEARQTVWAVNVNGIEIDVEPDHLPLVAGDVVQFDLGDLEGSIAARATVGAFPQPFTGGLIGARFAVTVQCAEGYRRACRDVRQALDAVGADPSGKPPPKPAVTKRIRRGRLAQPVIHRASVLVGPWSRWRHRPWPHLVDLGPAYSGVFVRFDSDGTSMQLLDWKDNPVRKLGPGAGLVAALCPTEADIQWLVTGVDRQGIERAARAVDADTLRDAFAVAVTDNGIEKLPLRPIAPAAR
jgi:hypothetical protein